MGQAGTPTHPRDDADQTFISVRNRKACIFRSLVGYCFAAHVLIILSLNFLVQVLAKVSNPWAIGVLVIATILQGILFRAGGSFCAYAKFGR